MQFLTCESDGFSCAIDMKSVLGMSRTEALQRDDMGFGCVGALPGDIPVFTLAHFLAQSVPELRRSMPIVILRNQSGAWGLIVDRVAQLQDITSDELFAWPTVLQSRRTRCFGALLHHDKKLYPVLRPDAMSDDGGELPPMTMSISNRDAAFRNGLPFHPSPALCMFRTFTVAEGERPISFGLAVGQILEMIRREAIARMPLLPAHVEGVMFWQGQPIPVIDLGMVLGLGGSGIDATRLTIARIPGEPTAVAIPTTNSVRIVELPIDHIASPRPMSIRCDLTHGVLELMNETLILPDLRAISLAGDAAVGAIGARNDDGRWQTTFE